MEYSILEDDQKQQHSNNFPLPVNMTIGINWWAFWVKNINIQNVCCTNKMVCGRITTFFKTESWAAAHLPPNFPGIKLTSHAHTQTSPTEPQGWALMFAVRRCRLGSVYGGSDGNRVLVGKQIVCEQWKRECGRLHRWLPCTCLAVWWGVFTDRTFLSLSFCEF